MKLSPVERGRIKERYLERAPVKVIAYEFGIAQQYVTRVAVAEGAPYRFNHEARTRLDDDRDALISEMFRAGLDTLSIAKRIGVREHLVANQLARIRDRERQR